jgi:hypothetical protein
MTKQTRRTLVITIWLLPVVVSLGPESVITLPREIQT